eukprot:2526517-Alexandrium_andersonii.AAC.1
MPSRMSSSNARLKATGPAPALSPCICATKSPWAFGRWLPISCETHPAIASDPALSITHLAPADGPES